MRLSDYTRKVLGIARTIHQWIGALSVLDASRRDRVARYAEEIAATLARAAEALARLETDPRDRAAARHALREFGRISGYVETIVGILVHHLDGRKLAGVKRRLEQLAPPGRAQTGRSGGGRFPHRQAGGRRGLFQGPGRCAAHLMCSSQSAIDLDGSVGASFKTANRTLNY